MGGPYLSEYEGEILVGLEDDVDEFRLAGRAKLFIVNPGAAEDDEDAPSLPQDQIGSPGLLHRRLLTSAESLSSAARYHHRKRSWPECARTG